MATPTVYTPKRLTSPSQLGTTVGALYTVPASTVTKVTEILLCNTSGATRTATLHLVPSAGVAANGNKIASAINIPSDGTPLHLQFNELYMSAGDSIQALASGGSSVTVYVSGVELA